MKKDRYPALMFVVRHGHPFAVLCGLVMFAVSLCLAGGGVVSAGGLVAGAIAGGIAYLLLRGLQDLLRLVAERMIEP